MTRCVRRLVILLVLAGAGVGPLGCSPDPTVGTSKEKPPPPKVYPVENPPKK